jgi:ATP-dependent helicase/nuclease subunit B
MKIAETLIRKAVSVTACFDVDPHAALDGSFVGLQDDAFYGSLKTIERLKRFAAGNGHRIYENYNVTAQKDEIIYEQNEPDETDKPGESGLSFLRRNLFRAEPEKYLWQCKDILLHTAESAWNECEQAASEILRLCRAEGYRFKDIIVAAPDYAVYAGTIEAVFEAWNIPLFSDRTEDIMQKPVMSAVEAAIDAILGGFEYRDMFRYLKTGLPGISYDKCCRLENYVLAWNIKGRQWISGREWTMNPKGFSAGTDESSEHDLAELNEIRALVTGPFIKLLQKVPLSKELPVSEQAAALYGFLVDVDIDKMIAEKRADYIKRGELKLAEEYSQLWGFICDA